MSPLPVLKFPDENSRSEYINAKRNSHVELQIQDAVNLLLNTSQSLTAEEIYEACYVDVKGNKAVFKSLVNRKDVIYDGQRFSYNVEKFYKPWFLQMLADSIFMSKINSTATSAPSFEESLQLLTDTLASPVELQAKEVLEILFMTGKSFTAKEIEKVSWIDVIGNKAVFVSLVKNPEVSYDGQRFSYKGDQEVLAAVGAEGVADADQTDLQKMISLFQHTHREPMTLRWLDIERDLLKNGMKLTTYAAASRMGLAPISKIKKTSNRMELATNTANRSVLAPIPKIKKKTNYH